jgi:hypothetical protein
VDSTGLVGWRSHASVQIEHPNRVTELVLRGIFLLRKKEIDWFYQGPGAGYIFPEEWALYEAAIPQEERKDYIAAYGRRLRGELGKEGNKIAALLFHFIIHAAVQK